MLPKNTEQTSIDETNNKDVMSDIRYICKSCSLITESLQKGCDVMQMPNGDIIISELKTVTFQYTWDDKKGKLVRTQVGNKNRKPRVKKSKEIDTEILTSNVLSEKKKVLAKESA